MNIQQAKQTLPILMKHDIVAFLWGVQGVGKTETVRQIADSNGGGFVHLHLATQEVGDLVGLLKHNNDGTVSHACPEWLPTPQAIEAGRFASTGIVFLDELNRAHPDVLQAIFSLVMGKTIHTHKLADGWKIVVAGNYCFYDYILNELFPERKSEFTKLNTLKECLSVINWIFPMSGACVVVQNPTKINMIHDLHVCTRTEAVDHSRIDVRIFKVTGISHI